MENGMNGISTRRIPQLPLNSGYSIPQLGFGTWRAGRDEIRQAVLDAVDVGYRHLDCAQIYGNEREIGEAIEEVLDSGKVTRNELFITSKIWNTFHSYEKALQSIDERLTFLRIDYLDLCLIHWPMGYYEGDGCIPLDDDGKIMFSDEDYMETWRAMEDAVAAGKIRSIGLSNFSIAQMERVLEEGRIKPAVLQVESHPYFPQTELQRWCKERGIVFTGYSTLANNKHEFRVDGQPNLLVEPILIEIGKAHGRTAAQVALRWALQRGQSIIPKSVNRSRIEENFNVLDFHLTNLEMAKIKQLDINWRMLPLDRDADHPYWPFRDEI